MTSNNAVLPAIDSASAEPHALSITPDKRPIALMGRKAPGWWGIVFLIMNEAVLFAALLASDLYLRFNAPVWPPPGIDRPELILPLIGTVLLVSSSFVIAGAESGIRKGDQQRLRVGLLISSLLSAAFLVVQAIEYSRTTFTPQQNAYTALFFGITGLHGMHVLIGVIANIGIQVRTAGGHFTADRHLGVQQVVLYSHFVDVVWIFVLIVIYLSVYL